MGGVCQSAAAVAELAELPRKVEQPYSVELRLTCSEAVPRLVRLAPPKPPQLPPPLRAQLPKFRRLLGRVPPVHLRLHVAVAPACKWDSFNFRLCDAKRRYRRSTPGLSGGNSNGAPESMIGLSALTSMFLPMIVAGLAILVA